MADRVAALADLFDSGAASVPPDVRINRADPDEDAILAMAQDAQVLMVEHTVIPDRVFAEAPGLRCISVVAPSSTTGSANCPSACGAR